MLYQGTIDCSCNSTASHMEYQYDTCSLFCTRSNKIYRRHTWCLEVTTFDLQLFVTHNSPLRNSLMSVTHCVDTITDHIYMCVRLRSTRVTRFSSGSPIKVVVCRLAGHVSYRMEVYFVVPFNHRTVCLENAGCV